MLRLHYAIKGLFKHVDENVKVWKGSLFVRVIFLVKRQVVVMVSIALVSFLAGALFSMGSTALDIIPNPFVNHLDKSELQVKVVRFSQPNEINVTSEFRDVATFVWIPNNPKNNSILAIYSYCEYRSENPQQIVWGWQDAFWWSLEFNIRINQFVSGDSHKIYVSAMNQQEWEQEGLSQWQQVAFLAQPKQGFWINPNQGNYTLTFQTLHEDRAWASTPTYVRNINVIITVVDGL